MNTIGKKARKQFGGKISRYTVRRMRKETVSGKEFKNSVLTPLAYRQMKEARRRRLTDR